MKKHLLKKPYKNKWKCTQSKEFWDSAISQQSLSSNIKFLDIFHSCLISKAIIHYAILKLIIKWKKLL